MTKNIRKNKMFQFNVIFNAKIKDNGGYKRITYVILTKYKDTLIGYKILKK